MDYKRSLGLGALAGVALDGAQRARSYAKYGQMIDDQIQRDCYALGQSGTLPPLGLEPPPLTRSPRNLFLVAALGAFATGAAFGVITTVVVVVGTAIGDGSLALGALGGVFLGVVVALVTTLFPGIFVGVFAQRVEAGKQHAAAAHAIWMDFHHERETIRNEVDTGHLTPEDAALRLAAITQE